MFRTLLIILSLAFSAPAASAQSDSTREVIRDAVVQELRRDGYSEIRIGRTLLGRIRFTAERPGFQREIVVHPRTGLILRDYTWRTDKNDDDEVETEEAVEESGEDPEDSGGVGGDDDDDDNDDDDDEDGADDDDDDSDDDDDDDG